MSASAAIVTLDDVALVSKIRALYIEQRLSVSEIARELNVERSLVNSCLRRMLKSWQRKNALAYDAYIRREAMLLDSLTRRYLQAWDDSRRPRKRQRIERIGSGKTAEVAKVTVDTEESAGDPRFLDGALKCSQERSKLIGLYAAPKAPVDATGNPVPAAGANVLVIRVGED